MAKVSIILPVYNREAYIEEAIESVLSQNYQDFELIIIDDGSTDATKKIITDIKSSKIKYHFRKNQGEYSATNKALRLVKGQYITWLHSDDFLLPESLVSRVQYLDDNREIEIVHGEVIGIDEKKQIRKHLKATKDDHFTVFCHYCMDENERTKRQYYTHYHTFMYRREILDKVGFLDEKLRYGGDLDWMMRALRECKIGYLPQVLYCYRHHAQSITRTLKRKGWDTYSITKEIQSRYCRQLLELYKEGSVKISKEILDNWYDKDSRVS
ncbi:MAG TPA: glycosyltransferase [Patescibacteria group bacterium]|nr:glycosyltransferase [Patescibacteria group bacterium]